MLTNNARTKKDLTAYNMGVDAFNKGKDTDDCPFTFTNEPYQRAEWMDGYYDRQRWFKDMMNDA